jgi:hypothetical protein
VPERVEDAGDLLGGLLDQQIRKPRTSTGSFAEQILERCVGLDEPMGSVDDAESDGRGGEGVGA